MWVSKFAYENFGSGPAVASDGDPAFYRHTWGFAWFAFDSYWEMLRTFGPLHPTFTVPFAGINVSATILTIYCTPGTVLPEELVKRILDVLTMWAKNVKKCFGRHAFGAHIHVGVVRFLHGFQSGFDPQVFKGHLEVGV